MRDIEDSRERWDALFRDNDTTADLRTALKSEQGEKLCIDGLRSICWKAFLLFDSLDRGQWAQKISESRSAYAALRSHFLKYIEHPDDLQSTTDPLADDEESPWQNLRRDEQMRADISQDVDRCLQDNFFFREPATKAKMIDILFIYSKLNPDLGYRQGMHELVAPILWVIDRDAIEPSSVEGIKPTGLYDESMVQLLDANYVEHDTFTLFCTVMQSTRSYYEHNRERSQNGQVDAIPIVHQCQHIHDDLLMTTDLELADHLQALEILPQIFLTRWMRLLFGREFPFQDVLVMWDVLFSEGLRPELIDFVCVAMLLRVRWQLLSADASTVLTTLLRYPSPEPHAPQSFVYDGIYLEQNPTPDRGAFIISKYSGKPPDVSKRLAMPNLKLPQGRRLPRRSDLRDASEASSPSRSPARNSPKSLETLLQDFSEGIQRRTESWGVAKAVRGAVSEAKRNMQTIQAEHGARIARADEVSSTSTSYTHYPRSSDMAAEMKVKLDALEERNRTLARTLSQTLNEMRSHLTDADGLDKVTRSSMKQGLNRIQSVQTCLEDPSATLESSDPLSPDTSGNTSVEAEALPDRSKPHGRRAETAPEEGEQVPVGTRRVGGSKSPLEDEPKGRGIVHNPTSVSSRPGTRPSLADSEFSWMLGGNRHISSFVSPASVPPEQTRHGEVRANPSSLFGNGEEDPRNPRSEPDGLALRSLRGRKG
ncbi:RabGAP/TBC [Aspergillus ambiguus]|uniref:GTPase-activating protein GYP6 n=1 Tax=Aspergillus ambiguus TaxID=176160 RepID=UPI003CCD899D